MHTVSMDTNFKLCVGQQELLVKIGCLLTHRNNKETKGGREVNPDQK